MRCYSFIKGAFSEGIPTYEDPQIGTGIRSAYPVGLLDETPAEVHEDKRIYEAQPVKVTWHRGKSMEKTSIALARPSEKQDSRVLLLITVLKDSQYYQHPHLRDSIRAWEEYKGFPKILIDNWVNGEPPRKKSEGDYSCLIIIHRSSVLRVNNLILDHPRFKRVLLDYAITYDKDGVNCQRWGDYEELTGLTSGEVEEL